MTTEVSTQNTPFFADIAELLTQARSNAEIGKLYGLTKERVRKIEQAAIEKINFACQNRKLDMEGLFEYE